MIYLLILGIILWIVGASIKKESGASVGRILSNIGKWITIISGIICFIAFCTGFIIGYTA